MTDAKYVTALPADKPPPACVVCAQGGRDESVKDLNTVLSRYNRFWYIIAMSKAR